MRDHESVDLDRAKILRTPRELDRVVEDFDVGDPVGSQESDSSADSPGVATCGLLPVDAKFDSCELGVAPELPRVLLPVAWVTSVPTPWPVWASSALAPLGLITCKS